MMLSCYCREHPPGSFWELRTFPENVVSCVELSGGWMVECSGVIDDEQSEKHIKDSRADQFHSESPLGSSCLFHI